MVHALSERYGAVHLHAAEGAWLMDRAMWSADRLHPGERGHRQLALRFHALLAAGGEVLLAGRNVRGRARDRTRAAIGHALAFSTWRSLVRDQGLDDAAAADLMARLVAAS